MGNLVRYRVKAQCIDAQTSQRFVEWMKQEHGQELLDVPGVLEYRVYQISENEVHSEYLFENQSALDRYFETQAPALRAKGRSLFSEEQAQFSREIHPIVDKGENS